MMLATTIKIEHMIWLQANITPELLFPGIGKVISIAKSSDTAMIPIKKKPNPLEEITVSSKFSNLNVTVRKSEAIIVPSVIEATRVLYSLVFERTTAASDAPTIPQRENPRPMTAVSPESKPKGAIIKDISWLKVVMQAYSNAKEWRRNRKLPSVSNVFKDIHTGSSF
eukprot:TRINITY_DN6245_c0_g1_i1.p2 TRINITY_DN6245_c0_g1~~TRINITY_DN6245_c0_g1_i1.p2  ORF type:complete len:168 (-),score=20.30 TRINITY_DN6245_c0_g1_i1:173-676(-)